MSRQKKSSYPEYAREMQSRGVETTRQQKAAKQEKDFVKWIHDLGATLRQVRHASDLSEKELAARLNGVGPDIVHLDTGFSDRVQIGDIKTFIDACDGSLEIIVRDKKGKLVSERNIVGASASASESVGPSGFLDSAQINALANLVVAKLVERLVVALSGVGAGQLKQEDCRPQYLNEPEPPPWGDADKPPDSEPPKE